MLEYGGQSVLGKCMSIGLCYPSWPHTISEKMVGGVGAQAEMMGKTSRVQAKTKCGNFLVI